MDLLRGDLNLIRHERDKKVSNDHLIADVGRGIEKLLDTFEIAIRLDELSEKPLGHGAALRGREGEHERYTLGENFRCYRTVLVHPESGVLLAPKQNGLGLGASSGAGGGAAAGGAGGSVFHHIVPPSQDSATWQLFFDVLARALASAAFITQENIETDNGSIQSSHLPELYRVMYYITHDEGKHLYAALRSKSILFQQDRFTCDPVTDDDDHDAAAEGKECKGGSEDKDGEESSSMDNKTDRSCIESQEEGAAPAATTAEKIDSHPQKEQQKKKEKEKQRQSITIDLSSFERRPFSTAQGGGYLAMLAARCAEWVVMLMELVATDNAYTLSSTLEFIAMLVTMPVPIQYITLHYLVADGLCYSIERLNKSEYFDWVIQTFIATRFFVGLATVNAQDFTDMMGSISRQENNNVCDASDVQIPPTIVLGGYITWGAV
jgi:hypothetical protein